MKKILSILLVLTMVFSLAACSGNTEKPGTTTPPTTESTTPSEPAIDAAAKQAFYDKYFTSEDYKPAGTSFKGYNDAFSMSQQMDANGNGVLEVATGGYTVRIYRTEAGVYVYSKAPSEENPEVFEEVWMKYTEAEGENVLEDSDIGSEDTYADLDIQKATYVETKDGVDYVKVEAANDAYEEGATVTEYVLKFTYAEKEYTMTWTVSKSENGDMTMWDSEEDLPEELNLFDYDFDIEKKMLVHESDETQNVTCEVVSTKDVTPAATIVFDMYINAETHELMKMGAEAGGVYTTMEYFHVEKYEAGVEFPEEADECTAGELGMIIISLLFLIDM